MDDRLEQFSDTKITTLLSLARWAGVDARRQVRRGPITRSVVGPPNFTRRIPWWEDDTLAATTQDGV